MPLHLVQKSSTLDDLERPYRTNDASFGALRGNLNEYKIHSVRGQNNVAHGLYFQAVGPIFVRVLWRGGFKRQWGGQNRRHLANSVAISSKPSELKLIIFCRVMKRPVLAPFLYISS